MGYQGKEKTWTTAKKSVLRRLDITSLKVLEHEFEVKNPIKNLGVIFNCDLSFNEQINQVIKVAGYHLRNIAFLKKYVDEKNYKNVDI